MYVPQGHVRGIVYYLHGGGWVRGDPDSYNYVGYWLACYSECVVVLPDYRYGLLGFL